MKSPSSTGRFRPVECRILPSGDNPESEGRDPERTPRRWTAERRFFERYAVLATIEQ
jgi:hypothetical protein